WAAAAGRSEAGGARGRQVHTGDDDVVFLQAIHRFGVRTIRDVGFDGHGAGHLLFFATRRFALDQKVNGAGGRSILWLAARAAAGISGAWRAAFARTGAHLFAPGRALLGRHALEAAAHVFRAGWRIGRSVPARKGVGGAA